MLFKKKWKTERKAYISTIQLNGIGIKEFWYKKFSEIKAFWYKKKLVKDRINVPNVWLLLYLHEWPTMWTEKLVIIDFSK